MTEAADTAGLLGRILPPLLVIVGGPLLIWWARRRRPSGSGLHISARTALTRGSVLAVVEVGDRRLLVGATDQGINLLTELPMEGTEESPAPPATAPTTTGPWTSPIDHLRNLTVRRPTRPRPPRVRHP